MWLRTLLLKFSIICSLVDYNKIFENFDIYIAHNSMSFDFRKFLIKETVVQPKMLIIELEYRKGICHIRERGHSCD